MDLKGGVDISVEHAMHHGKEGFKVQGPPLRSLDFLEDARRVELRLLELDKVRLSKGLECSSIKISLSDQSLATLSPLPIDPDPC